MTSSILGPKPGILRPMGLVKDSIKSSWKSFIRSHSERSFTDVWMKSKPIWTNTCRTTTKDEQTRASVAKGRLLGNFEQGIELYWNYVHLQTEAVSTNSDSSPTEILLKGETQTEDSVKNIKVDCINFV